MPPLSELKQREREILALLAEGKSARVIGTQLSLAAETVRWYLKKIYGKLEVSSRGAAVPRAVALGLLNRPMPGPKPVKRSPIRYLFNEGVSIAYQVIGRIRRIQSRRAAIKRSRSAGSVLRTSSLPRPPRCSRRRSNPLAA
jgi:DNA-binding CsgD family transcriptional regulator